MHFGITEDYDYNQTHKRHKLMVWSGAFYSVLEGLAFSLPKGNGYMVTTYYGDKVKVICPCPRSDSNWQEVDAAISAAMNKWQEGN